MNYQEKPWYQKLSPQNKEDLEFAIQEDNWGMLKETLFGAVEEEELTEEEYDEALEDILESQTKVTIPTDIPVRMYGLLQKLVISYQESSENEQRAIVNLLGLTESEIEFINNIIPDSDDGLHEIVD